MKLYGNLSDITGEEFNAILNFFYPECNKISIYFPNDGDQEVMSFKDKFLKAIELCEIEDETSVLEPKEGFTMVIASLSTVVRELLGEIHPSFHLSFGVICEEDLVLFVGEEGEIAIDSTNTEIENNALFAKFTQC